MSIKLTIRRYDSSIEFFNLGLGDYIPLSSISGSGTGELLDEITKHFVHKNENYVSDVPRFAVIGRLMLVNHLL